MATNTTTKPAAEGRPDLTAKVHKSTKGVPGKISAYDLALEHGISKTTLLSRITKGKLSVKEAATKPSAGNWRTKLKAAASKPAVKSAKKAAWPASGS